MAQVDHLERKIPAFTYNECGRMQELLREPESRIELLTYSLRMNSALALC